MSAFRLQIYCNRRVFEKTPVFAILLHQKVKVFIEKMQEI